MSMGDAVSLLEYWHEYPPTHLILRAVHLKPEKRSSSQPPREYHPPVQQEDSEAETLQGLAELQMMFGSAMGPQRPMPDHIKKMAEYAEEVTAKLRKTAHA